MAATTLDRALKAGICVLTVAFATVVAATVRETVVSAGDSAPAFSITTDDGRLVTPSNFGGRLLVLNFWATWCETCLVELPSLNQFAAQMKDSGVVVLAISVDTNEKIYRQFLERARPVFATARDPEADISTRFGTFQFPETYIINDKGKVLEKVVSNRDWMTPQVLSTVRGFLAGT